MFPDPDTIVGSYHRKLSWHLLHLTYDNLIMFMFTWTSSILTENNRYSMKNANYVHVRILQDINTERGWEAEVRWQPKEQEEEIFLWFGHIVYWSALFSPRLLSPSLLCWCLCDQEFDTNSPEMTKFTHSKTQSARRDTSVLNYIFFSSKFRLCKASSYLVI